MNPRTDLTALLEAIEHESRHLAQMIALLVTEQDDLVLGRTDRLESIAAEKLTQARALDLYAARRGTLMRALGVPGRAGGTGTTAYAALGAIGLGDRWRELADKADEARTLNAINGRLIAQRMLSTERRLSRLVPGPGMAELYGANGLKVPGAGHSRPLGQV